MVDHEIRYANREDIQGLAKVYVRAWKAAYRGIVPSKFLDELSEEMWENSYRETLGKEGSPKAAVLIVNNEIAGVSSFGKSRDLDMPEDTGEIFSIYLIPEFWRIGLGTKLFEWVVKELKTSGFKRCVIGVLQKNTAARGFYLKNRCSEDTGSQKTYKIEGEELPLIRYFKDL